jgi:uncharacterized membrane protein
MYESLSFDVRSVHLVSALGALIFGTIVLVRKKGSLAHKRWGYLYSISMAIMLLTSFMIYDLFRGWGLFHYFSVVSSLTLIGGFVPAFLRKPDQLVRLAFKLHVLVGHRFVRSFRG